MTVGVPEINLDTWGLKYVKKKRDPNEPLANETSPSQGIDKPTGSGTPASPKHTGLPESKRPRSEGQQAGAGFESGKPSKNISATNRISDADLKTPDSPKGTHGTQGTDERNTFGADRPEKGQGYNIPPTSKLTPEGTPTKQTRSQNPKGTAIGAQASHDSGHRSVEARTGRDRAGDKVDPEKKTRQPKSGLPDNTQRSPKHENKVPTGSGAPKIKAEMELAIIKCKLLKMNDISKGTKDYGSDNTGRPSIGIADDPESTPNKQSVKDPPTSQAKDRADESVTSYGEGASGNQRGGKTTHGEAGDKQLNVEGKIGRDVGNEDIKSRASTKSDDIVEKAIELINEAYGEMNKSNPVIVSDPKGKPFCSNCGRNNAKEDAKALEGTDDQQQRMVSGTRGGNKPSCPSCGHRPNKKAEDTEGEAGVNLKNVIEDLKETKKEGADGGTSTTSSEGGFNHVYSDVHEAKRQKQNQ